VRSDVFGPVHLVAERGYLFKKLRPKHEHDKCRRSIANSEEFRGGEGIGKQVEYRGFEDVLFYIWINSRRNSCANATEKIRSQEPAFE